MADKRDRSPTLEDAFKALSNVGKDRLTSLSLKLECSVSDTDKLVYAMVLMNLRRRQEARTELQKLGHNQMAVYLAGMTAKDGQHTASTSKLLSGQADFLVDVARIFKVLVAERLCDESLRDNAYLIAMEACKNAGGKSKVSLEHLKVESRTECGPHLELTDAEESGGAAMKSSAGLFSWVSGMLRRSPAVNIHNSKSQSRTEVKSSPSSLQSLTEFSVSFASHLEISQSPTVPFLTDGTNKALSNSSVDSASVSSTGTGQGAASTNLVLSSVDIQPNPVPMLPVQGEEERNRSIHPGAQTKDSSRNIDSSVSTGQSSAEQPSCSEVKQVQCTADPVSDQLVTSKTGLQEESQELSALPEKVSSEEEKTSPPSIPPKTSVEESHPETKPSEPPRNPTPAPTTEQEGETENKFFSFVILHAREDTDNAIRVQDTLEQLGAGEGATFSTDFEIPGKSPLTCIQDAVNNSAFTIILLTTNFNSHWAQYKTNSVLMDSIQRRHKYNTVIPFLPRRHCLPRESIPFALRCLIAMEENKSLFPKKVKKTFNQKMIENQRALWSQEQKIKQQKEKEEQLKDQNKNCELLQSAIVNVQLQQYQQYMALQYTQMLQGITPPQQLPGGPNPQYPPHLNQMPPGHPHCPLPGQPAFNPAGLPFPGVMIPNFAAQFPLQQSFPFPTNLQQQAQDQNVGSNPGAPQPCPPPNIIQIHHASNIQIGNQAQMSVSAASEEDEDEEDEDEAVPESTG
ncbi:TIR domain-containing adapter molecule 1 [Acipenser oxyrinchus oxyrinchus]|uniref:TIR domain-containing adapter molecule 1 n=1 Tax=Acipenser oxyrinchus oxyrinchus TaxID=40147 RepID=A0AAD8CLE7_ACIOX|nr:TIR domain-containing adapter molecule 1 [Acipenser oxyrinchus oxyrinchus]